MHKMKKERGELTIMCCVGKTIGTAAFSFGIGVALCLVLPTCALVCVQAALIICVGVMLFLR